MSSENERRLILGMIESGKISAEDGLRLLQALPEVETEEEQSIETLDTAPGAASAYAEVPIEAISGAALPMDEPVVSFEDEFASGASETGAPDFNRWRGFWVIPLWIGVGITISGSLLMFWAAQTAGLGFWFFCAGVPFALGIMLLVLAWQSRSARWLHLRVKQKPGEWPSTFALSYPLPIRMFSWFMRTFRQYIPGMETAPVDDVLATLEGSTSAENPLYIEVEEDDGERVQIYIG